ncbi:MAG: hypothetical protein IRY99_24255, partial [Isosphaeraceae bacterium]|nr:hypothetical protein [Isosphaeraceae bacterium]
MAADPKAELDEIDRYFGLNTQMLPAEERRAKLRRLLPGPADGRPRRNRRRAAPWRNRQGSTPGWRHEP